MGFGLNFFFVDYNGPSLNVIEEGVDGFVVVADVFLPFLLEVLFVNDTNDDGDAAGDDGHFEVVLPPEGLLLLLKFEELLAFCLVDDRRVDDGWLGEWAAVEVVDVAREPHLGLIEDEHKAAFHWREEKLIATLAS